MGLVRGFLYGCLILLIAMVLGMDEDMFNPLLVGAIIISGIIGMISGVGKSIEADENGIYLKNKEYLFAENDMYMQVETNYYNGLPVTSRCIMITGNAGKSEANDSSHTGKARKCKVKCSFLSGQDAGRLAKIIEDAMRKKYREVYDDIEHNDVEIQSFKIPAAELVEVLDKRVRLMIKTMFWFLTVVFSLILISMIRQDQLEEYGLGLVLFMGMNVLILGGVDFFICRKIKKSIPKIPREITFAGGHCYIDSQTFGGLFTQRVVMTPERGEAKGDMRRLVFYDSNDNPTEYNFGFRADRKTFPEYGQLVEAVKENFGSKFAYDIS